MALPLKSAIFQTTFEWKIAYYYVTMNVNKFDQVRIRNAHRDFRSDKRHILIKKKKKIAYGGEKTEKQLFAEKHIVDLIIILI